MIKRQKFIVLWSYVEGVRENSGYQVIYARTHSQAEKKFYKYNRKLIVRKDRYNRPIYNPLGGYIAEVVLTDSEWKKEHCPKSL